MKKLKWIAMLLGMIVLSLALPVIASASEPATEAPATPAISNKKLTLYIGEKQRLKVTGTDETIKWSSSKKNIARVTKTGKVKALRVGKTTITASFGDDKLKCRVIVKQPTIKLNKKNINIDPFDTFALTAKVAGPSDEVTWKSSNKKIAVVSTNGVVTGKTSGTAVISATANKVTAQCVVTVGNDASLYLDQTEVYLQAGEKDVLEATLVGSAKKSSYTWSSSNTSVATISANDDDCIVTAVSSGTATITVKYGSLKATCKVIVVGSKAVARAEIKRVYSGGKESDYLRGFDSNGNLIYDNVFITSGTATESYLATVVTHQNYAYVVTTNSVELRDLQTGQLTDMAPLSLSIGGSPNACVDNNGYLYCVSGYMGSTHIVYKITPYALNHKLTALWSSYLYSTFLEPYSMSVSGSYLTIYDAGPNYSKCRVNINYGTVQYYK